MCGPLALLTCPLSPLPGHAPTHPPVSWEISRSSLDCLLQGASAVGPGCRWPRRVGCLLVLCVVGLLAVL